MAWADNCVYSHVNHLEWSDDCIIVYFSRSKGDQEGVSCNNPWHIYLNPFCPEISSVLALTKYVLVYPTLLKVDCPFFSGDS